VLIGYGGFALMTAGRSSYAVRFFCTWYVLLFAMGSFACWRAHRPASMFARESAWIVLLGGAILSCILIAMYPNRAGNSRTFIAHYPLIDPAVGLMVAAGLVLLAWRPDSIVRRALEYRPLVRIGVASYSLYLTHQPCLQVARALAALYPLIWDRAWLSVAVIALVGVPMAAAITWVFYHLFEKPLAGGRPSGRLPAPLLARPVLANIS